VKRSDLDPLAERLDTEPVQLDLEALWDAVEKPQPIVTMRRRQVA
jgi:hypothetical protein